MVARTAATEPGIRTDIPSGPGAALSIHDISHCFELEGRPLPVLDRISLRLDPGEFVAILGPSGCGKSTLLRLVAGLDSPATGTLFMDGQAIDGPDASRIIVFQDPTLYPWRTVWSNVALGWKREGCFEAIANASVTWCDWSALLV